MTFREAQEKAWKMAHDTKGAVCVIRFSNDGRLVLPLFQRYADEVIEYMMFPYSPAPLPTVQA